MPDLDAPEPAGLFPEGNFASELWACLLSGVGQAGPGGAGPSPTDVTLSLQADLCIMTRLLGYVDLSEPHFVAAVLAIVFNPLFWALRLVEEYLFPLL